MTPYPHEPLSPAERELARLTARLPPQGEPSPALDARILAAAHAATTPTTARKTRPRWPMALGLAASVVFAVGIAWQLRPLQEQAAVLTEMPASAVPPPQAAPAADATPAAQAVPAATDALPAHSEPSPADAVVATAGPMTAAQPKTQPPQRVQRARAVATAKQAVAQPAVQPRQESDHYLAPAPPAPPAPMAPAPAAMAAPTVLAAPAPTAGQPQPAAALAEAEATQAHQASRAAGASSARLRAETDRRKAATAREAKLRDTPPTSGNATLERVEVSGSRLRTDLQVPVSEDTQLPVHDWLERVRTRYGLGDAEAARQSLLLFVREHPRENVPDDLEPLLKE